jgi:hypothetical protein
MTDRLTGEIVRKVARLERYLERNDANDRYTIRTSVLNVSNPPTDAELDAEFGTPATVGNGFLVFIDDAGGDAAEWLVFSNGTSWWYVALTKAV